MDTMFTLQHQQLLSDYQQHHHHHHHRQSFNSTVSSSSSRSSTDHQTTTGAGHYYQPQEECFPSTFFMEEDDLSSSSSLQQHYYSSNQLQPHFHHQFSATPTPTSTTSTTTTPPPPPKTHGFSSNSDHTNFNYSSSQDHIAMEFSNSFSANGWASDVLLEAARAVADKNSTRLQQLMWMLNELSSPYGDVDEKLSCYFLQALYSRMTDSGELNYRNLSSISEKVSTFESTRELVLKFQEVSPWTTFGHVACNGAILEALDGETKLHIVDVSNTYCTQWPTLLEAIATRADEAPHLRLTTVISSRSAGSDGIERIMREIGSRMEKFARLMGVPFKFNVIHHIGDLSDLNFSQLAIQSDEALAINLNGTLRSVSNHRRDYLISMFRSMNPKIMTIVEEEADLEVGIDGFEFLRGFQECLKWFRVYFEALNESFPQTSTERLMLEREAGRAVMDLVACSPANSVERRETANRWSSRLRASGFGGVSYSEEGCDDVRALLRRYKEGWSMAPSETAAGIFLMRKETPVVWASAWKPV
ncbi:hypothetical protein Lser_V15G07416 [Lactuca serriola]